MMNQEQAIDTIEKAFINKSNKATFMCPECSRTRTANMERYRKLNKAVKVNCSCACGHTYSVLLERRNHFRKKVSLPGTYIHPGKGKGFMTILDISLSGAKLELFENNNIIVGDRLLIEFVLNDKPRTQIQREITIRNVKGDMLGGEFDSPDHFDKLGPYLLYNIN